MTKHNDYCKKKQKMKRKEKKESKMLVFPYKNLQNI